MGFWHVALAFFLDSEEVLRPVSVGSYNFHQVGGHDNGVVDLVEGILVECPGVFRACCQSGGDFESRIEVDVPEPFVVGADVADCCEVLEGRRQYRLVYSVGL